MEVIKSPDFTRDVLEPVVVAIGSFDGLHLGHQKIIEKTIDIASRKKYKSGVFSFYPHPAKVIKPEAAPLMLISEEKKIKKLASWPLDYYFQQKFTRQFSRISFEEFMKEIFLSRLKARHVVVGNDFRFGYRGKGNVGYLKNFARDHKFGVTILPPFKIKGQKVSSSLIRKLVREGRVSEIPLYLGEHYQIKGRVIHGQGRGHKLGFPTANLDLKTDYVIPAAGVYAGYAYFEDIKYKAIANFGYNPSFPGEDFTVEVHLIGLEKDIYGEELSFELIKFLRKELYFSSSNDLIEQIKKDILYTEEILC